MSRKDLAAFLEQIGSDDKLRANLAQFAADHGFQFTPDELSEADLGSVVGGVVHTLADPSAVSSQVGGSVATFPDVCATPGTPAAGPVPVPYPNSSGADDQAGTKKTKT